MLVLATALARHNFAVTVANGGAPSPWPTPDGVALTQLEPVQAGDATFTALVDASGQPVSEALWQARRQTLEALTRASRPELVVVEMFPFGRRAFARELVPWLMQLRREAPTTVFVSSVRDVLVSKSDPMRYRQMAELACRLFDLVLVHADPALVPFGESFPPLRTIQDRLRYAGYLVAPLDAPEAGKRCGVVVSAGGGAVGSRLLACALAAQRLSRFAAEPWTLVCGPRADPAHLAALQAQADTAVRVLGQTSELPAMIATARVSVSQAGYNTVAETLATRTPMVLVPFAPGDEDEQTRRALRLAERGFARVLQENDLEPLALARAIDAAAQSALPDLRVAIDSGERAAALLAAAVSGRRP
jgi:predicted glycosyltransferase